MGDIYVAEIASTDPRGTPWGKAVQAAVCRVDGRTGLFDTIFFETVYADPLDLGKDALDRLSAEYGIYAESLYSGLPEEEVSSSLG